MNGGTPYGWGDRHRIFMGSRGASIDMPRVGALSNRAVTSSAPRGARRRSPSPRPGAPPATPGWWFARSGQAPRHRATPAGASGDRQTLQEERDFGQNLAVRAAEPKLAVGLSIDPVALFVNRAVVPATEPVTDVMALAEPDSAAREPTAAVSMVKRSPQRRRNRACPGPDLQQAPVCVVAHHDPARVARLGCTPKVRHGN